MINYHYLLKNPRLFFAFSNTTEQQFCKLLPKFITNLESLRLKHNRERAIGGGSKPKVFDKPSKLLMFTLFFVRVYPTYDLAQCLFELDKSRLHYWFHLGLKALEMTAKGNIPLPAVRCKTFEELFVRIPQLNEHILDATEQRTNRPKYNQEDWYSGKKKCHTKKRQIICTPEGRLVGISTVVSGKTNDKTLAEDSLYLLHAPPESTGLADLGYQGINIAGYDVKIGMPIKKKRKQELSDSEKETNRIVSSVRVKIENVIGRLKFSKMFSDKIRYRLPIDDMVSNVVGGLYNFKLDF